MEDHKKQFQQLLPGNLDCIWHATGGSGEGGEGGGGPREGGNTEGCVSAGGTCPSRRMLVASASAFAASFASFASSASASEKKSHDLEKTGVLGIK